tara:strand:+ start:18805 stop:20070 length:1266 start_codon:yes stop_codon:yes gene_type:complete
MKAINFFSRTVPCKKPTSPQSHKEYLGTEYFSIVEGSLLRTSYNGTLAISGKVINHTMYLDNEVTKIVTKPLFKLTGVPEYIVNNMLNSNIIERTSTPNSFNIIHCSDNRLPYYGRIEITDACQCDCDICYKMESKSKQPSLDTLKERIIHLRNLGIVRLEVLGGEPLLRRDLGQLCDFITQENFMYTIITNGEYLIDLPQETINSFKSSSDVIISIDSYGELHDKSRKRDGLFEKDIEGLKRLKQNGINCSILCTVNHDNEPGIDKLIDYLKPFEVDLFIRPTIMTGAAAHNKLQNVDMTKIYEKHKDTPHVFHNTVHLANEVSEARFYGCDIRQLINIDINGQLMACHMDRQQKTIAVETYSSDELLKDLNDTLMARLNSQKSCINCDINNSADGIKCGGLCKFSKSFIKNDINVIKVS